MTNNVVSKNYVTVLDTDQLKNLVIQLSKAEYVAYDIETTGLNPRLEKIIGISVSTEVGNGWYVPVSEYNVDTKSLQPVNIGSYEGKEVERRIVDMLQGKKIICHNASFDLRFTKHFYGIDLLPYLWADTMLLVHTVQEGGVPGVGGFALKEIATSIQQEIGIDAEAEAKDEQRALKASITANGGSISKSNYELWKADLNIIGRYAAADTDLTLRVYYYYLKKLQHEGLEDFYFLEEVMPVYREVTIPMESDGIRLDLELINKINDEIQQDIVKYRDIVEKALLQDARFKRWLLDKVVIKYPPGIRGKFASKLLENLGIETSLKKKDVEKLPDDNIVKQYLLTGDVETLDIKVLLQVSLDLWKEENDGHLINLQSKQQLASIVFEYFKEKPLSTTTKGAPQFDDDMLDSLSSKYTWAKSLQIYNKLVKIKSAYVDRFLQENEDGRFYPYFKQHGTVSGRYGSNLQQLPKPMEPDEHDPIVVKYVNIIRAFFISDPGCIFVDCDYQALEPHIFASITDDKNLQEIFEKDYDFYSYVAIKTKGLTQYSPDKKADNFLKKLNPSERNGAKPYALGMAYGMSPYALAMSVGVSQKEGELLHKGYLDGFPGVAQWIEDSRKYVKEHGFIRNHLGRTRHLPEVKELYNIFGDSLMDWRFRKTLARDYGADVIQKMYMDYRNGLNSLLNFQIQSMAASVVNRAAVQINRRLKQDNIPGKVIAQIHDQLLIQVPEEYGEQVASIVQQLMENTTTLKGITLKAPPALAHNFLDGH